MKVTGTLLLLLLAGVYICLCVYDDQTHVLIMCSSAQHICSLYGQSKSPVAVWANDRVCPARRQRSAVQRVRVLVRVRGFWDSRWRCGQVRPCLWGAGRVSKKKTFSGCCPAGAVKFTTSVTRRAGGCPDAQPSVTFPTSSTMSSPVQTNRWPAQVRHRSAGSACNPQLEVCHYSSNAKIPWVGRNTHHKMPNPHERAHRSHFVLTRLCRRSDQRQVSSRRLRVRPSGIALLRSAHLQPREQEPGSQSPLCELNTEPKQDPKQEWKPFVIGLNLSNKGDFWRIQSCLCLISADLLNWSNWF